MKVKKCNKKLIVVIITISIVIIGLITSSIIAIIKLNNIKSENVELKKQNTELSDKQLEATMYLAQAKLDRSGCESDIDIILKVLKTTSGILSKVEGVTDKYDSLVVDMYNDCLNLPGWRTYKSQINDLQEEYNKIENDGLYELKQYSDDMKNFGNRLDLFN